MTKEIKTIAITPLQARLLNRMCYEELEQQKEWLENEEDLQVEEQYLNTRKHCIKALEELQEQICKATDQEPYFKCL